MRKVLRRLLTCTAVLVVGSPLVANDWPQFLGPTRDGRYAGKPLARVWPDGTPREIWRTRVGQGLAGPVVAGDRLILFHRERSREVVEAWDVHSGQPEWRYEYATTYRDDFGFDEGPRSVPVVAGGRVFTFGAQGQLHAVDLETGEGVWSVDTKKRFSFRKGFFGAAGSPLVEDGRVIANVGGREAGIVAFAAETGEVLWTSTRDEASYSSPVGATFGGVRHAVFFTRNGVVGLDSATGRVRFQRRWHSRLGASVNAATPLVIDDLIFVSASYGTGAGLFRVEGAELAELWSSDDILSNHYATSVYHDGYLYGYHGRQEYNPSFRAVELRTGEVQWNESRFRSGTVTLAGDLLVIVRETGELLLAEASPDTFQPLARAQVLPSVIRAYPALANGLLYVRNENTLVCLDLRPSAGVSRLLRPAFR